LRQELGISQEELAARAELHRNYIGSIERGERDVGLDSIAKLSSALGLSLAAFFSPFDTAPRPRRH
jgi:transcriptional regulator with XRE-family HTH domain